MRLGREEDDMDVDGQQPQGLAELLHGHLVHLRGPGCGGRASECCSLGPGQGQAPRCPDTSCLEGRDHAPRYWQARLCSGVAVFSTQTNR